MNTAAGKLPQSLYSLLADQPETVTLENGLTIVCKQDTAHPLVSAQVWVKTGSIHEGDYLGSGLSHFLEHMLFNGTNKRGPGRIAKDVQALGGEINAYTTFDRTVYYIDGPSESIHDILEILADQTLNSTLPHDEVEKEREVILREIDMTLDDPHSILTRGAFSNAYRHHPYRYPVIGYRQLFEKVSHQCLSDYYRERYQPANMVLVVTGKYDRDNLLDSIGELFGKVERHPLSPIGILQEPGQLATRETRLYGDYNIARGIITYKIPSLRHPSAPALDIMTSIIGTGHSGRLRKRLREELQLVHHVHASVWNPSDPGLLFIQYQSDPDKADEAEKAIIEFCSNLAEEGFSPTELEKARKFATIGEVRSRQTTSRLASRMGLMAAVIGELNYPERYFKRIYNIDTNDLVEACNETFRETNLCITTLLPESCRKKSARNASSLELPPFEEKTLLNGARIYWQRDHRLPRTYIKFMGLGGTVHEEPDLHGSTSLLATMLTRDTKFQSAIEVADSLESQGGFMSDATGNNTYAISLDLMPEMVKEGVAKLEAALFHPAFKESTFFRERDAQLAHLKDLEDEILDYGRLRLRHHFFGRHPFSSHPCGTRESAARIDIPCIRNLRQKLLVGSNAVIVVAGDFDPDLILPDIEKLMGAIPAGMLPGVAIDQVLPAKTGFVAEHMDREQAVVFQAYPDPGLCAPQNTAAEILDEILSDMSGPMFQSLREEQSLAYFLGTSRLLGQHLGAFTFYAGTHPSKVDQVFAGFDEQLDRIKKGELPIEIFDAARTSLKIRNRSDLQNPGARATKVALNILYGKPAMDWLNFENQLNAVTVEQLADFAQKQLDAEKRLRLTVTPN